MIRMSWARAASVEETLALWAASLREIKQRIRPLFTQERVATNAGLFLEGLLGDEQRKTGWMRAEAAGDPGPWRQRAILGRGESVMRSGATIHGFGREDHELPDRRLRCLRFASWPCVHRSRVVSSEGMDRRSRSSGSYICACRCRLCDQTKACDENDRTRDSRVCTIQVGCR